MLAASEGQRSSVSGGCRRRPRLESKGYARTVEPMMRRVDCDHAPTVRLWAAVCSGYLAFGATLQVLPAWVHYRFGGGPTLSGLAVGIAFAATAAGRPLAGVAGDAGRGRGVVLAGGCLIAVGALGQLFTPDVAGLILARLVMGAGEAALFSGALPWVLSPIEAGRRAQVAGWFGLSMWGGLAVGPIVATAAEHAGGLRSAWVAVVVLGLISAAIVALTSSPKNRRAISWRPGQRWCQVLPSGVSTPGVGLGLAAYGYGTISSVLVLYLAECIHSGQGDGLVVFAAAFLTTRVVGSPVVERHGGNAVALVVLGIDIIGFSLLASPGALATALIGVALTGVGVSLMYPAAVHMTLRRTGPLQPGTSVGAMTSFWDLGILVAGPLSGALAAGLSYRAAFLTAAVAAIGSVGVTLHLRRGHP